MYKRKRVDPRVIGIFVIGAIILGVSGLVFFGPGGLLSKTERYVLHFDSSVKGLNVGSPVRFRGVKIGQVKDINVRVRPADFDFRIPVLIEIEPSRIGADGSNKNFLDTMKTSLKGENPIQALVDNGLRARLELDSLVTGQLYVNFDMFQNTPAVLAGYPTDHQELPTIPSSMGEIAKTFEELPLRQLAEKMVRAADGFEKMINSTSLHDGLARFDETMMQLNNLLTHLDGQVLPLTESLQATLLQTQAVIKHLDSRIDPLADDVHNAQQALDDSLKKFSEASDQTKATMERWEGLASTDSNVQQQVSQTLQEISKAARSVRYLTSELERDPQLLLRGRVTGEKQ
ncbi:MAG TPA: MlaD family protein [Malonomonas sp.]